MNLPVAAIAVLLATALAHILPGWTRPEIYFAVSVDPAFRASAAGRRILLVYRTIVWASAAAAMALLWITGILVAEFAVLAGFAAAIALAHRQVRPYGSHPNAVVQVDLAAPRETLPGGYLFAAAPLIALALLGLWAWQHWYRLPARIPIHWGFHGADRWIARTTPGVYGFIALHAALTLCFELFAWGILHWSRRISAGAAPAERDRRFRRLSVQMLMLVACFPAVQAWTVLSKGDLAGPWWMFVLLAVLAVYIVLLVRINRTPAGDPTPDDCWKLGMFYVNPGDPSVFVQKRFGIGYTINLGNRWSWTILGALAVLACAGVILRR